MLVRQAGGVTPPFPANKPCPCGSRESLGGTVHLVSTVQFGACCGPLHDGTEFADTAERLMRSRYSAYVVGDVDYLLATWHPSTRPQSLQLDSSTGWRGLTILGTRQGGPDHSRGTVELRRFLPEVASARTRLLCEKTAGGSTLQRCKDRLSDRASDRADRPPRRVFAGMGLQSSTG